MDVYTRRRIGLVVAITIFTIVLYLSDPFSKPLAESHINITKTERIILYVTFSILLCSLLFIILFLVKENVSVNKVIPYF